MVIRPPTCPVQLVGNRGPPVALMVTHRSAQILPLSVIRTSFLHTLLILSVPFAVMMTLWTFEVSSDLPALDATQPLTDSNLLDVSTALPALAVTFPEEATVMLPPEPMA